MFDFSSGHTFALSDFGTGTVFGAEVTSAAFPDVLNH